MKVPFFRIDNFAILVAPGQKTAGPENNESFYNLS
jgi:hypothetical protein